jgi:hypothetical protein
MVVILAEQAGLKKLCLGLSASARKKNIGKPYEGKPHVRFDEEGMKSKMRTPVRK